MPSILKCLSTYLGMMSISLTSCLAQPHGSKREHYDPKGSTKSLGGYLQLLPYIDYRKGAPAGEKSLEETAEIELKASIACGLTDFQFYFPFGDPHSSKPIVNASKSS
jgi:hypothetical protein